MLGFKEPPSYSQYTIFKEVCRLAKLDGMPSSEIVGGFRGVYDFYYYKGIPCVRAYPDKLEKTLKWRLTSTNLATANRVWRSIPYIDRHAFRFMSLYSPMSARDCFFSVYMLMSVPKQLSFLDSIVKVGGKYNIQFALVEGIAPNLMWNYAPYLGPCMFVTWRLRTVVHSMRGLLRKSFPVFRTREVVSPVVAGKKFVFEIPYNYNHLFFCLCHPSSEARFSSGVYTHKG